MADTREVGRELVSRGKDGAVYHGMTKVRMDGLRVVREGDGLKATKEDLGRPGEFGWQREVVRHPQGGHVTGVHYVTPPDPATGERRRFNRMRQIAAYLATAGTPQLSLANFVLNTRALGLAFEVERRPIHPGTIKSQYVEFMRDLGGGRMEDGRTRVGCTLCTDTVPFQNFSHHMRKQHLPEEECVVCGEDFAASSILQHRKTCRGTSMASPATPTSPVTLASSLSLSTPSVEEGTSGTMVVEENVVPPAATVEALPGGGGAADQVVPINFMFGGKKYKVRLGAGRKMKVAMKKVAKEVVGRAAGELEFVERATGARVAGGEAVGQFTETVIDIRESC